MQVFVNFGKWVVAGFLLFPETKNAHDFVLADGDEIVVMIDGREIVFQRRVDGRKVGRRTHVNFICAECNHGGSGSAFEGSQQCYFVKFLAQQMDEAESSFRVATIRFEEQGDF